MILLIAIIVGAVFFDQLTKWLAVVYLQGQPSFSVVPGLMDFTFVKNPGAALGMFKDQRWLFMLFSAVAIVAILVCLIFFRPKSRMAQISLAMICGGGIGNMIDRVMLGYVIDFIDFSNIGFVWVFNVADAFVTVGTGLMILYLIMDIINDSKKSKAEMNAMSAEAGERIASEDANDSGVE